MAATASAHEDEVTGGAGDVSSPTSPPLSSPSDDDSSQKKIFVGGLRWETDSEKLRDHFLQYGRIREAAVIFDRQSGRSKGYGFVTFFASEDAKKATNVPRPIVDGRQCNCNLAYTGTRSRAGGRYFRGEGGRGSGYVPPYGSLYGPPMPFYYGPEYSAGGYGQPLPPPAAPPPYGAVFASSGGESPASASSLGSGGASGGGRVGGSPSMAPPPYYFPMMYMPQYEGMMPPPGYLGGGSSAEMMYGMVPQEGGMPLSSDTDFGGFVSSFPAGDSAGGRADESSHGF